MGPAEVRVTVAIVARRASRAVEAGLVLTGARRDRVTSLSTPSVVVTLSGEVALLDALEAGGAGDLVGEVVVEGLGNGRHEVVVAVRPREGLRVVSVAPDTVVVRISPATSAASPVAPDPTVPPSTSPVAARRAAPSPSVVLTTSGAPAPSGGA